MNIHIFTTGGTFDKVYFDALSEFSIGEPFAKHILQDANVSFSYTVTSLLKKDSLELTDADRTLIKQSVEASSTQYILIIHGTDTMALTAKKLINVPNKTIVLTGAMQPARMQQTDAAFNLGFALAGVQSLAEGVYIAMNGQFFPANQVRKNREAGRFQMLEAN